MMSREELAGVMAHGSWAHVKHRDTLTMAIAATIGGAIAMLANMAQFAMLFGMRSSDGENSNPFAAILMMILAPIAASLIQMAISRSREYVADAEGAAICGNPLWLASALRKLGQASQRIPMPEAESHPASAHLFIVNPLSGRNLAQLFATTSCPWRSVSCRLENAAYGRGVRPPRPASMRSRRGEV